MTNFHQNRIHSNQPIQERQNKHLTFWVPSLLKQIYSLQQPNIKVMS